MEILGRNRRLGVIVGRACPTCAPVRSIRRAIPSKLAIPVVGVSYLDRQRFGDPAKYRHLHSGGQGEKGVVGNNVFSVRDSLEQRSSSSMFDGFTVETIATGKTIRRTNCGELLIGGNTVENTRRSFGKTKSP